MKIFINSDHKLFKVKHIRNENDFLNAFNKNKLLQLKIE